MQNVYALTDFFINKDYAKNQEISRGKTNIKYGLHITGHFPRGLQSNVSINTIKLFLISHLIYHSLLDSNTISTVIQFNKRF